MQFKISRVISQGRRGNSFLGFGEMGKVCPHGRPAVCTHTCQGLPLMLTWKGAQSKPPHEAGGLRMRSPPKGLSSLRASRPCRAQTG